MPRASIGFIFLFLFLNSFGQGIIEPAEWKNIDSAIRIKRNILDIENQLLSIKTRALAEHNDAAIARSMMDLMMIKDYKSEDTLFFKNAAFMDSILSNPSTSALLKSIIHLLLARRIYEFEFKFFYRSNKNLFLTGNPAKEYATMDKEILDSLMAEHLNESIAISKQLVRINIDDLLWLSSDPLIFLFRPDYTDLLFGERIFLLRDGGNHFAKDAVQWLSESQDAFIQNGDRIKTFTRQELTMFHYYHEWIQYNILKKPEAAWFIETLARKYFYHGVREDSACKIAYKEYLGNLLLSPYNAVTSHAVYQLCKMWYDDALLYNPSVKSYTTRYKRSSAAFDSIYRLYHNKTLQLLNRFDKTLDSFPYLKDDLLHLKATILAPGLNLILQDVQLPDSSIPVLIQYKNISHLYTRTIRISPFEELSQNISVNIRRFLKVPSFTEKIRSLILPDDHQWHNSFLAWEPLAAGRYIILYSDTSFSGDDHRINYIDLSVSNIAIINNDYRIFVLNRVTGLPIKGATVLATVEQEKKAGSNTGTTTKILPPKTVNEQGFVVINEKKISKAYVYIGNDSIQAHVNEPENPVPDELYSKDNYDDISDYYEENIRLSIYTDRAIYRPGQTVFFKGIFTVPDPKTGELRALDLQKIKFPFFENLVYKTVLTFKKLKTDVTISDPFSRTVDTFKVTPNKFGSFSGSFAIPKDAATGEWNFDTEAYKMANQNSGKFRVEEYKRPTYKLTLTKPKTELKLGDSFNILIKVRSFAGAPLNHVRLSYHVFRRNYGHIEDNGIFNGELISNESGESNLMVRDSSLFSYDISGDKNVSAEYNITVESLDETGESHEQELRVYLSNRPVHINLSLPDKMDRNKMAPVNISMRNDYAGPVKKPVDIYVYKMFPGDETDNDNDWPPADLWIENKKELQRKFPEVNYDTFSQDRSEKNLVYKISLPAEADKKIELPAGLLATGFYQIKAVCSIDGKVMGETGKGFSIYDTRENNLPGKELEWLPANTAFRGDTLKLISGNSNSNYFSIYHMAYQARGKNGATAQYDYIISPDKKGINEMDYKIPSGIIGSLTLTHLYIIHNHIFLKEHHIQILDKKNPDPDIIIEKYRTQLSPGEKETFAVSIKTKHLNEAAELMTTMYDASLDELEEHNWFIPKEDRYYYSGNRWNNSISSVQTNNLYFYAPPINSSGIKEKPIWWISSTDLLHGFFNDQFNRYWNIDFDGSRMLQSQVSGLMVVNGELNDVVVSAYGMSKQYLTGTVMTVNTLGIKSLSGYAQPMIILDGVLFTGDINKIKPESIFQGIILKGADAVAAYGDRATNGVLILSTHGPVILPIAPEAPPPPLVIRKNFSETAFFYPMIYAGKDGMYSISFTMPESVTEWKWKLFAHTRKAGFAYLEKSLFSQLPLMVQPSMPRFLYQGDKLVLKTRITNLDTTDLSGQLKCTIEDDVTGEDISSIILKDTSEVFIVKHQSNTAGSFMLSIPSGFLHPLRIRISAATSKFSDGEEHIIPILSKKFLTSKTAIIKSETSNPSIVTTPAFPEDAEPYGLSLYINPKPQATLLNALTYLAFDPYGCSEQTLNKMLAFSMAVRIARIDSFLRNGISKIPIAENTGNKEKDAPEPDEQTMPWLNLSHATLIQQQKLKQLFDTTKSKKAFEKQLTELMAMQNTDGGLSWFKGGRTDAFISTYVLAGLGKMYQDKLPLTDLVKSTDGYPEFLSRLITYIDNQLTGSVKDAEPIEFLYARSYWLNDHPVSSFVKSAVESLLVNYFNHISDYNIYQQVTLVSIDLRFNDNNMTLKERSFKQLESIRQLAISDTLNGICWKDFSNADDLDRQDEETVARIAEAFQVSGKSEDVISGIVKWLLKNRNEHAWTTKSTASIVGLLQTPDLTGEIHQLAAKTGDSLLKVTDNLFGGLTANFLDLSGKRFPSQIYMTTTGSTPVYGGIKYYYFSSTLPNDSLNSSVQVNKNLFRYDNPSNKWEPIKENTTLQISDKIKTVLTIKTVRQLNYVFINERRAATMEPQEIESGYKYEDGLGYYQSVKDAGYLFFVDKIPSGIHTISYETVITASGNFTNGPASLECMYQPSINAYSNVFNINVSQ